MNQINKVLVANRGEIARRIMQTLHQMGISSVTIYHEADAASLHVKEAEERFKLNGNTLAETYLDIHQIIDLAKQSGADAIHPGYGFLSENPAFASAVIDAGLIFIGPSAEAIRIMGNKKAARALAAELDVPVIDGASGDTGQLLKKAAETGFPVLVKAAAGGGGKGMRIANHAEELEEAIEHAGREALSYFGNAGVYIEKYLAKPRHIEVQLLADHHGHVLSLFERECSVQRRHQKIIEEAPAPNLNDDVRQRMMEAARKLARHISYTSAGTVEFLAEGDHFYFLEMNTRIQVEHPVTEMITGLDLVKEQVHIAAGRPLPYRQEDLQCHGHAIEARIYAEDPDNEFLPSPGKVLLHKAPSDSRLRIDTALDTRGEVSSIFDPMISKVIYHASSRETARKKMIRYLNDYVILGVKTNIAFLKEILGTDAFADGQTDTGLAQRMITEPKPIKDCHHELFDQNHLFAMAFLFSHASKRNGHNIWGQIGFWRLLPEANLMINDNTVNIKYVYHAPTRISIPSEKELINVILLDKSQHTMTVDMAGCVHKLFYLADNGEVIFQHEGKTAKVRPVRHLGKETLKQINENPVLEGESMIHSPMHGTVIDIQVGTGQEVSKGETLLVLESMKMENKITATAKAYIKKVHVIPGEVVPDNAPLVHLIDKPPDK